MCMEYGVYSMCVKPCDIQAAKKLLEGSGVKVSCVLSFPHGADATAVKAFQAKQAIADGTDEIDMVMNIGKFLGGEHAYVVNDIKAVVEEARRQEVLVKVILETGFLSLEQVTVACELAARGGAHFVKTSTGFGPGKATPEAVEAMLKEAGKAMKVKASGGIRTWEDAVGFLAQGVDRLGIGSTRAVLEGAEAKGNY